MRFCPLLLAAVLAEEELPDLDVALSNACPGVYIKKIYTIMRQYIMKQ